MHKFISTLNETQEYEKSKNIVQLSLMAICLLVLCQIFLFCYAEKKEYNLNINELKLLCDTYPGYFRLANSDTELIIYMDNTDYDIKNFDKNGKIDPWNREDYTPYYIKVDSNGKLVFTDSDIESGVKSFYTKSLDRAYKETFRYRRE